MKTFMFQKWEHRSELNLKDSSLKKEKNSNYLPSVRGTLEGMYALRRKPDRRNTIDRNFTIYISAICCFGIVNIADLWFRRCLYRRWEYRDNFFRRFALSMIIISITATVSILCNSIQNMNPFYNYVYRWEGEHNYCIWSKSLRCKL